MTNPNLSIDADGLGVTFTIGGQTISGRLPLITAALEFIGAMSLARDEWQKTDIGHGVVYVQTATIGLCWQGPGLNVGDLRRDYGRNLENYGEAVRAALINAGVARLKALPTPKKKKAKKCAACKGKSRAGESPCKTCDGSGVEEGPTELDIMYAEIDSAAVALATQIYAMVPSQGEVDEARADFTDPPSEGSNGEGAAPVVVPEEVSG